MKLTFWQKNSYIWFILPFIALPLATRFISILSTLSFVIAILLLIKYHKRVVPELIQNRYLYLFLALFIPVLISLIDSLSPSLTAQTLWRMVRYFGYAVIAILAFQTTTARNRFSTVLFWILMAYCIDAICQWLFGYNIYGYNPASLAWQSRVRGVFGERYDLGFFLAALSPFIFFYLFNQIKQRKTFYYYLSPIFIIILMITILISGARSALIPLAASIFFSLVYLVYQKQVPYYKTIAITFIILLTITAIIAPQLDVVTARFQYSVNANSLDQMTSGRINLWNVAWSEYPNYWLNGVGARGFDALYQTYPESYKTFQYMNHPHLQGLEVLIETGIIGFILYLIACIYLLVAFLRSQYENPWLLVTFLAIMPINSYAGVYEGNWLPMIFIPLAIAAAFSIVPKQ